jgi:hypothetical protein
MNNNIDKKSYLGYSIESLLLMQSIQTKVFNKYGLIELIDKLFQEQFKGSDFHGLPLIYLRIILCNQLNPPIKDKQFQMDINEIYIRQYFLIVSQNLISFDIREANGNGTLKNIAIIIISMTLGFCNEVAYVFAYNFFNKKKKNLVAEIDKEGLFASQFQTAIYPLALNISSSKCTSFPINLPNCGDCVTILTSKNSENIRVHFTELKVCNKKATNFLDKYSFVRNKQTNTNLFTNTMITYEMYSSCIRSFSEDDSKNNYIFLLEIIGKQKGIFKFPVKILKNNFRIIFNEMYKRMCILSKTYLGKNNRNLPSNQYLFEKIITIFNSLNTDNSSPPIPNRLNLNVPLSNTKMSPSLMMSNNPLFNFETVNVASPIERLVSRGVPPSRGRRGRFVGDFHQIKNNEGF